MVQKTEQESLVAPLPLAGNVPVPDPTLLTTQNLRREISGLRELIEARLDGMDKAHSIVLSQLDHGLGLTKNEVGRLQELHDEKFRSIETQFKERDTRTEQTSKDSKVAVDAALQAAKEAVGEQNKSSALAIAKSEASTTKQIDQIAIIITTLGKSLDDKVVDLKDRLTALESRGTGQQDLWGYLVGAIGLVVGIISAVFLAVRVAH